MGAGDDLDAAGLEELGWGVALAGDDERLRDAS
jgi:hypothetical protein